MENAVDSEEAVKEVGAGKESGSNETAGAKEPRRGHKKKQGSKRRGPKGEGGRTGTPFTRRLWTEEEDDAITSLVEEHGIRKWTLISKRLHDQYHICGRSGKQCRERHERCLTSVGGTTISIHRSRKSP